MPKKNKGSFILNDLKIKSVEVGIKRYMGLAHLPTLKKKRGMHSLRHTMASMLLEHNTPISIITDILGHIDTDSTSVYLKVDIKKLKECSLDFVEENDHE